MHWQLCMLVGFSLCMHGGPQGCPMNTVKIKHIRAKPSALSQNLSELLVCMRRCFHAREINFELATTPSAKALGVVASSKVLGIPRVHVT